mmetsp:Transcript_18713/g.37291  ORF Transcript_18713/g.37291 Transcript_18713/m.37291 type:complete len:96 (-) Transcript_18713:6-293(-)
MKGTITAVQKTAKYGVIYVINTIVLPRGKSLFNYYVCAEEFEKWEELTTCGNVLYIDAFGNNNQPNMKPDYVSGFLVVMMEYSQYLGEYIVFKRV